MGRRIVEIMPELAIEVMKTGWTSGCRRGTYIECIEGLPSDAKMVSCQMVNLVVNLIRIEFESAQWPDGEPQYLSISYSIKNTEIPYPDRVCHQ